MLTKENIDGSWILSVFIDTLGIERKIRVMNDWSIARVINKTIEDLKAPQLILFFADGEQSDKSIVPFSEYNFWWPDKAKWILHHSSSLSQYGIQADTWLRFTPTCGPVNIQLPDLQERIFPKVNFSDPIFRVVNKLCKTLGIRYPEELSLMKPSTNFDLKRSRYGENRGQSEQQQQSKKKKCRRSQTIDHRSMTRSPRPQSYYGSSYTLNDLTGNDAEVNCPATSGQEQQVIAKFGPPRVRNSSGIKSGSTYLNVIQQSAGDFEKSRVIYQETLSSLDMKLIYSPYKATLDTLNKAGCPNLRPLDITQKCRLYSNWLDSSKSLMEQGYENFQSIEAETVRKNGHGQNVFVRPQQPLLQLRFKYGLAYDLNPKYDHIRINQMYNQVKWSVLMDHIECSENEACLLAAIQLHIDAKTENEVNTDLENASIYNIGSLGKLSASPRPQSTVQSPQPQDDTENVYSLLQSPSSILGHDRRTPIIPKRSNSSLKTADVETLRYMESEIDRLLDEIDHECDIQEIESGTLRRLNNSSRVRSPSGKKALANESLISSLRRGGPNDLSDYEDTPRRATPKESLPTLSSFVRIAREKKSSGRLGKRIYVVLRDSVLFVYKDIESSKRNDIPLETIDLRGCHVEYCNEYAENYCLKLFVPLINASMTKSLSSAKHLNEDHSESEVARKLKSRGSFLSLTSLSNFIYGGLDSAASFIAGCVERMMIQLNDEDQFVEWGAMCGLAGQLGPRTSLDEKVITVTNYNIEREKIKSYLSTFEKIRSSNGRIGSYAQSSMRMNQARLLKRPIDYLPLRMSLQMSIGLQNNTSSSQKHSQQQQQQQRPQRPPQSPRNMVRSQTMDRQSRITSSSSKTNYENYVSKDELTTKILNIYDELSSQDSTSLGYKLRYIGTWRSLSNHEAAYFLAIFNTRAPLSIVNPCNADEDSKNLNIMNKFNNIATKLMPFQSANSASFLTLTMSKKEEILAICQKRIFRIDPQSGNIRATWKFSNIQGWHVNFELNEVMLYLAPLSDDKKTSGTIIIRPTEVPVNMMAEYLGGYALLTMRAPFKRQDLDEKLFYQLTSAGNRVSIAI